MANENGSDDVSHGTQPSGADTPQPEHQEMLQDKSRIRNPQGGLTPAEGHEGAKRVPEEEWEQNNRRKDTATAMAQRDPLIE